MARGTLGLALKVWKAWRRLPPARRRRIVEQLRRHGPKAAALARSRARRLL